MTGRVARLAAVTFGWIPLVPIVALMFLDATAYEGYRPEEPELITAATVGAAIAGLLVGFVLARRVVLVVVAVTGATVLCLLANDALYRYVIPLPDDLRGGGWDFTNVIWAPLAAAAGYGLGQLRPAVRSRRAARLNPVDHDHQGPGVEPVSRRRLLVGAAVVAVVGALVVPEFLRIGAELVITDFSPGAVVTVAGGERVTVPLDAGRHALFGYFGSRPCAFGDGVELSRTAVALTDNSDSIVTVLLGTFEVDAATSVVVTCAGEPGEVFGIGDPPEVRGPLGAVVSGAPGVPWGIGLFPGLVLAAVALARRRPARPAAAVAV